ncbi:hypothetical protein TWF173_006934 [Orbilia oligospora]|nr:hypothetical protein TWF173_006934 [Orbilia oligospora]
MIIVTGLSSQEFDENLYFYEYPALGLASPNFKYLLLSDLKRSYVALNQKYLVQNTLEKFSGSLDVGSSLWVPEDFVTLLSRPRTSRTARSSRPTDSTGALSFNLESECAKSLLEISKE